MPTKSIGSAGGRDYATLALWAAFVNAQNLASTGSQVGECYNDSEFTFSSKVTLGGWTNADATHTVTLRCAAGQSFRDNANVLTNALYYNQANGVGIRGTVHYNESIALTGPFFFMDGLQIENDSFVARDCVNDTGAVGGSVGSTITNCIMGCPVSVSHYVVVAYNSVLSNCLVYAGGGSGHLIGLVPSFGGTPTVTDVTAVAPGGTLTSGIDSLYPGALVKNTVVAGVAVDYTGTASASSTNNATDQASFGGTNFGTSGQVSVVGSTEFQSFAIPGDFRVKPTSVKLKGNGATAGPTDDIAKQSRTAPYTIGCWQFVPANTSSPYLLQSVLP